MTLTIVLPAELEKTLRQKAAQDGQDVADFVRQAVEEKIARGRSFDEICAPFARAVAETGMSDEEFEQFFTQEREEAWREKQGR
jgi:hypothetical protein